MERDEIGMPEIRLRPEFFLDVVDGCPVEPMQTLQRQVGFSLLVVDLIDDTEAAVAENAFDEEASAAERRGRRVLMC